MKDTINKYLGINWIKSNFIYKTFNIVNFSFNSIFYYFKTGEIKVRSDLNISYKNYDELVQLIKELNMKYNFPYSPLMIVSDKNLINVAQRLLNIQVRCEEYGSDLYNECDYIRLYTPNNYDNNKRLLIIKLEDDYYFTSYFKLN